MCGIIGYTGIKQAKQIILDGLFALEYRGYDSAGLAVIKSDGKIARMRSTGRVGTLAEKANADDTFNGNTGIGHTRWATHGAPMETNAHPHRSGTLTLVHNGIIDNYLEIKKTLENKCYVFSSETDTECAAHLIDSEYRMCNSPAKAIYAACKQMRGSYALAIMFDDIPDEIYCVRKDNPLILALADDGGYVASDIPAILPHTRNILRPNENEVFRVRKDGLYFISEDGKEEKRETEKFELDVGAAKKDGYDYFMLKEINEEPKAIKNTVTRRINGNLLPDFSCDSIPDEVWKNADSLSIIACGSATHAGLVGRYLIETLAGVPVNVNTASEYRYDPPASIGNTLAIPISQSGETADTLAGLRLAKKNGNKIVSIVNAVGSAVARESDYVMYEGAGPEIAVATTKGYTTQVAMLAMIAVKLALIKGKMSEADAKDYCRELSQNVPKAVSEIISRQEEIREIAKMIKDKEDIYFIGRGPDYPAGSECSLKLKEISYIHSEAYAAGELKHGTLSLIEQGTPVIALASDKRYYDKTAGNVREVKARGGFVVLVCGKDFPDKEEYSDCTFILPDVSNYFTPITTVVFSQLLAYETALLRGNDVDHPRNLAKSVTVE